MSLFLVFIQRNLAFSQEKTPIIIAGLVKDDTGAIAFAQITIVNAIDTLAQKQVSSNTDGVFSFTMAPGDYFLKIAAFGRHNYQSAVFKVQDTPLKMVLPAITLSPSSQQLNEVVVKGQSNPFEVRNGKLVFNVSKSITAPGSSALELLRKTPGVALDQNEQLLMKGSAVSTVLIDGKATYLSPAQLSAMLKGMSATNIDRIEVSDVPTAEFDAAGSSGVINIITKKSIKTGYALDFTTKIAKGVYFLNGHNVSGNIKTNKFNIFGNLGYDYRPVLSERSGTQLRVLNNESLLYQRTINDNMTSNYYSYKVGADYYLNKNAELGFVYNGYIDDWRRNASGPTVILKDNNPQSIVKNQNSLKEPYYNNGFNINYSLKLDTFGSTLKGNADYVSYLNNSDGFIANSWTDFNGNEVQPYQQLNFHQPSNISIKSLKGDYNLMRKKLNVKTGLKFADVTIDNNFRYDSLINNNLEFAPSLSDNFVYNEKITAAYLSTEKKWAKTTLNAGLRLEFTQTDANSINTGIRNKRNYLNLFPSITLENKLDEDNRIGFSISRRINRPVYSSLNPVRYFSDKYAYYEGNPNLRPELAWVTALTYTFKENYIATLTYNRSSNFISQSAVLNDETGILVTSNINFKNRSRLNLLLINSFDVFAFWKTNNSIDVGYNKYPLQQKEGFKNVSKVAVDLRTTNNFTLTNDLFAELSANYTSPTLNGVYVHKHYFSVDAGVKRNLLNNRLTINLNATDIFRTIRYQGYTITNLANNQYSTKPDTRRLNLSLVYHLGGKLNKSKSQHTEEQERL